MATKESDVDPTKAKVEDAKVEAGAGEEEEFPDPDEDDLDDLDDMLDDFSSLKVGSKKPESALGPGRPDPAEPVAGVPAPAPAPAGEPSIDGILSDDDFAKQLQAGMADLLGEMESSPEMQAQFESIFKELGAAASAGDTATEENAPKPAPGLGAPPAGTSGSGSFQDTIRQTMERMQASGDQATAAASADSSDDFMAELLKQMEAGGMGGLGGLGGEGGEEDFSKMLLGMMEQLTNKEILYEPMKELDEKFPAWLDKNRATTAEPDLKRYEEQRALVREIVAKFEEPTFSDENAADREYIVDRMQKMQAHGSPPADLVGDMPSAQDALNMSEDNCNMQ